MAGELVITDTGSKVDASGRCASQPEVVLANSKIPPTGDVPMDCARKPFWIRHGANRLSIVVSTRYGVCTRIPSQAMVQVPACLPGEMMMPPLPAGRYRAVAAGFWYEIPKPASVAVRLWN